MSRSQHITNWVIAAVAALLLAVPGHALLPTAPDAGTGSESETVATVIDDTQSAGEDDRIASRITEIFAQIPALTEVEVAASEGVVSLSGTVPDPGDVERAEAIASRVSGVVTVENAIERDISVGAGIGGLASLKDKLDGLLDLLPLIGLAILVGAAITLAGYLVAGLSALWRRITPNSFLAELIASAIRFVAIIGGIIVALDIIGATALLGAVLGGAGVIGIALGFAMRDTIENYVASLMLSLRQPFRANDHVVIDDKEGVVIRLTSRATVLMTLEGNHLRIPNGQVFRAVILNYTRNPHRRFEFELGIDADDDPRAAMKLGVEKLSQLPFVLTEPAPASRIQQVGDSNIVIRFLAWVDQDESDWHKSRSLAIATVKEALEAAGFALPEPIYRLRFDGRSDAVPIAQAANTVQDRGEVASQGQKPKAAKAPPARDTHDNDVRPQSEINEMVEKERSEETGESDLLDPSRPVE